MCKRGDVYYAELPVLVNSRIQQGYRPVVIVCNQRAIDNSPVYQCIPLTSQIKKENLPVHVVLTSGDLKEISMVLGEQITSIDKYRLKENIGTVSDYDMKQIERAMMIQLGLTTVSTR